MRLPRGWNFGVVKVPVPGPDQTNVYLDLGFGPGSKI